MNRLIRTLSPLALSIAALAAIAPLATTGCSENKQTIAILGALPPPKRQEASEACLYSGKEATSVLFSGAFDLNVANNYTVPLLVENFLAKAGDDSINRAESNNITINTVEVTIYNGNAPLAATYKTAFTSGFIPAAEKGVVGVTLIPTEIANVIQTSGGIGTNGNARQFRAVVRASGTTSGNIDVETPEFQYMIEVGKENLLKGRDAAGACPPISADEVKTLAIPCQAGIDQPIHCAICTSKTLPCPAYK
jgi:hypothetical protein